MYFLGSISGASGAANNQQSGGFDIPPGTKSLYLVSSAAGVLFEFGSHTGSTGATFQTTDRRGALIDSTGIYGPFPVIPNNPIHNTRTVVGIYNTTGGNVSVRVYASPTA